MIGVRVIPLVYIICTDSDVPMPVPPLAPNQPHSEVHGSIEYKQVERASHKHPLFRDDNSEVYFKLKEATCGTMYAASIKPFQCTENGRGAYAVLTSQYTGRDKWESEIRRQDDLLTYYTIGCGRDNPASHLRGSSHNIRTPSYQCNNVSNMCHSNFQMNT